MCIHFPSTAYSEHSLSMGGETLIKELDGFNSSSICRTNGDSNASLLKFARQKTNHVFNRNVVYRSGAHVECHLRWFEYEP